MKNKILFGILALFLVSNVFAYSLVSEYTPQKERHYDFYEIENRYLKNNEGYGPNYMPDYKERYTETKYYPKENRVLTITRQRDYENDKRFSTYEYRHGYTYRETKEYWESSIVLRQIKYVEPEKEKYLSLKSPPQTRTVEQKSYYIRDIPYLNRQEKVECYINPPKGKLFYIKCP